MIEGGVEMQISREKLSLLLAKRQFTMATLAKECGISRNRIYVIVNSRSVMPKTVGRIADALEVDIADIIEK